MSTVVGDLILLFALALFILVSMHINILVHELGHTFAGREVGLIPKEIVMQGVGGPYVWKLPSISPNFKIHFRLFPIGAHLEHEGYDDKDLSIEGAIFSFGGGPLANIILVLVVLGVNALFGWGVFSPVAGAMLCSLALILVLTRRLVTFFLFPFATAILPLMTVWFIFAFFTLISPTHQTYHLFDKLYVLFTLSVVFIGFCGAIGNLLPVERGSDGDMIVEEIIRQGGRMGKSVAWCQAHTPSITLLSLAIGIGLAIVTNS